MFTLVCCNFSKSQGGKIQTLLELSYHSHLKKEGMTAAIAGHMRRGGCSKPYYQGFLFYTFSENRRAPGAHFAWVFGYSLEFFLKVAWVFPDCLSFLRKSIISCKYWRENGLFWRASRSFCHTLGQTYTKNAFCCLKNVEIFEKKLSCA